MTKDEVLKINKEVIDSWNNHDTAKFLSLCHDNIVWNDTGAPQPYKGKEGAKKFYEMWDTAFPDFTLTIGKTIVGEDCIAAQCVFNGTNTGTMKMGDMPEIPATNRKITANQGSYLAWFKDGKLAEINTYPDLAGMMMQLGLMQETHA